MYRALHDLIAIQAGQHPDRTALVHKAEALSYGDTWEEAQRLAAGLQALGLTRGQRVAVFLEKRFETVLAIYAASAAGGVFVPVNPVLRPLQVAHILNDCAVTVLITSAERLDALGDLLENCPSLQSIVVAGSTSSRTAAAPQLVSWQELMATPAASLRLAHPLDGDMGAILYTSGSTGHPKGVVLSHRNLLVGAESVSQYLENDPSDRILSVLPLSFDAGLSQILTAARSGACCILLNYLLPREMPRVCAREKVTGLTGVPPLWFQLLNLDWPEDAAQSLRYFANTGGHLPRPAVMRLREIFPKAAPYLMYGLTEAFRSTYLDPREVDRRPDSMGKAIPNAEILVVREDGSPVDAGEVGELVHRGPLVSLGYWNDPERTAERFRPAPGQPAGLTLPEIAVWSGDLVRRDEDGFLYFVGRRDDMIKTSGYRVSPTEIEEVVFASGLVDEVAAIGLPHETLGQAIVLLVKPKDGAGADKDALLAVCRQQLPAYMLPHQIEERQGLYRNPNGKIDRKRHARELSVAAQESQYD
ncbi:acyl-CoA ligase (AMP-forming), exosortase A system-associated [Pelagibius sp.]|uniref:acyl-CoA ligase (AMP-forming), exosortase A system-associated n=1 Tax=Pelagibius sp. TaxID=1931238 RepID=UPI0026259DC1|nr:acyl-CoA ligase (AMP-forming), exosortase A system-associated [Pelagibius sp.]